MERRAEKMLELIEKRFNLKEKTLDCGILSDKDFIEFTSNALLQILSPMIEEVLKSPPITIVDCGVNEAAFTHAKDPRPIAATDSLATCIGIAGYVRENKNGFVFHIATESELKASKEMLFEKIMEMSRVNPIELHLSGGYLE